MSRATVTSPISRRERIRETVSGRKPPGRDEVHRQSRSRQCEGHKAPVGFGEAAAHEEQPDNEHEREGGSARGERRQVGEGDALHFFEPFGHEADERREEGVAAVDDRAGRDELARRPCRQRDDALRHAGGSRRRCRRRAPNLDAVELERDGEAGGFEQQLAVGQSLGKGADESEGAFKLGRIHDDGGVKRLFASVLADVHRPGPVDVHHGAVFNGEQVQEPYGEPAHEQEQGGEQPPDGPSHRLWLTG